jgi:hypothetical protein
MPIRIEDVIHLEEIKASLAQSVEGIKAGLAGIQTAFGEVTFGFLTVVDSHNKLEAKLDATQTQLDVTQARLDGEIATIKRAMNLGNTN